MKCYFPQIRPVIFALWIATAGVLPCWSQEEPEPARPAADSAPPPVLDPDPDLPPEPSTEEIQKVLEDLSADDFRTREAATLKLWKLGSKAEPLIREAAANGNIELRTRAARLLGLFKYGIYPDTPPEIVKLINQFRHGTVQDQTGAIKQLYSAGAMDVVTKLIRSVEDQNTRKRLVNAVVAELDRRLADLFAAQRYDEVEPLLSLAAISDEGLRDFAAFHLHRGTLDAKVDELLERDVQVGLSPVEHEQLSWFYRLKGDLDKALLAAGAAKNKGLERDIRIAQGDLLALIRASYDPRLRTIQAFGFTAAAQRLSGDTEALDATVETIKKYAQDNPKEVEMCARALLINGRAAEALEISQKGGIDRRQLLIDHGDHLQALAELGITDPKPPYTDWLDSVCKEFSAAETQEEYSDALDRPFTLTVLLLGWGEIAEAERIYNRLGEVAAELKPDFITGFIRNASALGLHQIALKYSRTAFAKEAADAAVDRDLQGLERQEEQIRNLRGQRGAEESILDALYFQDDSTAGVLWERFELLFPDETSLQRIDRTEVLLAPIREGQDPTEHKAAAFRLLAELAPGDDEQIDDEEKIALLSNMVVLYLRHGNRAKAMESFRQSLEIERPDTTEAKIYYGQMLALDGRWEEATAYLKAAADNLTTTPFYLVRYAIALEHCGRADEAAPILKRARLQALGRPTKYMNIAAAFAGFGEYDRACEASEIAVNIATLNDRSIFQEALRLSDYLSVEDPARSAVLKERYLIECLRGKIYIPRISTAPSIRGSIGSMNARVAIAEGRVDDAVKMLRGLIESQPSNSSLLEDLYPLLVRAGRAKEADELYKKLNQYGEDVLALFPNCAQDLNSNAWLKARCGKDLDLALQRSQRSNELSKDNDAYLDTLAEIHFQRGDRNQAIAVSEGAVKLSRSESVFNMVGGEFLLYQQLQRFKNAKPLSELLAE